MLRAASSLRLTTHCPRVALPIQQKRSYLFLPASFQELQQLLQEAWTTHKEKRRTILVKLRPKQAMLPKKRRQHGRRRLLVSRVQTRMRHLLEYQQQRALTWKRTTMHRFASRWKYLKLKSKWKSLAIKSRWKSIVLKEPCQRDWFDTQGYPKAVRNAYGRFVNPWSSQSTNGMQSLWKLIQWRMERLFHSTHALPASQHQEACSFPPPNTHKIQCTWLGHSTTLVQMPGGFTVLTDPMFSQRASPIQAWGFGVPRHAPPPCSVEQLPAIHVCAISHDHYDHLDQDSILQLRDKVQYWAVPLEISVWLQEHCDISSDSILELEWWQRVHLKMRGESLQVVDESDNEDVLTIVCAPAQHWCGRTMWDRNQRLWCSWALSSCNQSFYFAGDTGYPQDFPLHQQIGDLLGPFDLAALPIGAYSPSYFMKTSHVNPTEAVQIHKDLQAKRSVAIHWGTFPLAEEPLDEPPQLLQDAAHQAGVDFVCLSPGETITTADEEDQQEDDNEVQAYG